MDTSSEELRGRGSRTRRFASPGRSIALAIWGLCTVFAGDSAVAKGRSGEVELRYVNGVYENLGSDLDPVRQGPLTIHISSPEHRLTIHSNRLRFESRDDGALLATMTVDFEGHGRLIARVEGFGRFTDDVEAPRQTVEASGIVRLSRIEEGYLFTVVDSGDAPRVEVESGVASQLVGACRAAARLPLVKLPCDGLDTALTSLRVPMPDAGREFVLPSAEMTRKEKRFFNRYVADR